MSVLPAGARSVPLCAKSCYSVLPLFMEFILSAVALQGDANKRWNQTLSQTPRRPSGTGTETRNSSRCLAETETQALKKKGPHPGNM